MSLITEKGQEKGQVCPEQIRPIGLMFISGFIGIKPLRIIPYSSLLPSSRQTREAIMIKCLAQGHKWGSSKVVPVLTVGTAKMLKFLVESPYSQSSSTISTKTGMRKPENMTG